MKAILVLQDGTIFEGTSFGAEGTAVGEVVFSTGMTGYQEVITDPSNYGQMITMTYPLIGNYGINDEDSESEKPYAKALIVRELCETPNNWRSSETLNAYLKRHSIIGLEGIDTRALTRILREKGTMNGVISTECNFDVSQWLDKVREHRVVNPVKTVTTRSMVHYPAQGFRVALMDLGVKAGIVRSLQNRGCEVYIFPASASAEEFLAVKPDGIMLPNGPGNPKDCVEPIETIKKLFGKKPIFGICLGHLVTALAAGANTEKLQYGHRGCNHPVKDIKRDITYITSQNHGYTVVEESLNNNDVVVSHINMNDGTIEGLRYLKYPAFTVQFHPEASPGPMDTAYLFDEFIDLMARCKA